jgi:outer membrane protein assembly factor BamE (lipoprotein component of BamABCDE complex)
MEIKKGGEMKTTSRYVALVVVCVTLFIGCASTRMGTDFNSENVSNLKVGKTTEQEVIQLIGQPIQRTRSADGTVTLEYMYDPGQTIHAFTPITNPNYLQDAGKGQKMLTVILGSDGKVKDFTERESP